MTGHSCAVSNRTRLLIQGHFQPLYDQLQATSVFKADGISTQYTIRYQDGETIGPISQNTGHVHIEEQEIGWRIYVPQDRDAREICYKTELPPALASLFKIPPLARENLGHVLNSRLSVIDELLENGGVGMVPGLDAPERNDGENVDADREEYADGGMPSGRSVQPAAREIDLALRPSGRVATIPVRLGTPSSSVSGQESGRVSPSENIDPFRSVSPEIPEDNAFVAGNAYLELLDNVIRIARQAILPRSDALVPGIGGFHPGYVHNEAFGVRTQGQMNHDFKIGAAGELFVSFFVLFESSFL
jgi:hypothetical protein